MEFHLRIPEAEVNYFALYMRGRGNFTSPAAISEEIDNLVLDALREIRNVFNIDLTNDVNFRIALAIASDHGGYQLKEHIKAYLASKGVSCQDFGTNSTESCDYPVFGRAAAEAVAAGQCEKGIVICTTGIGISITANKVKGIRCALCSDSLSAELTRRHNNTNVLAIGAGIVGENLAERIVDTFLNTNFEGTERHARRVAMIDELDNERG